MTDKLYGESHQYRKFIIRLLLLAFMAFYCIVPLVIHKGLPYAHDIIFHVFQADQFNRAIHEGILYPRWVLDLNNGYGSASFIFYSPLSYYLVSGINILTPSITIAMITAIWFGIFFSGVTMFVATRKILGGSGSALPAVIYQILPFHLWNIYIRGTFAELFAFIWFPLIILFLHKTIESRNKASVVGLSISYAGLILTHLVSGFIFTIVIGAYFIYNYFLLKDKKRLLKTLFALILGLGLSSVYLIPVIFERKFVQIEYLVNCLICDYKKNFLFMWDKFQPGLQSFYFPLHVMVILEFILFLFIVLLILKNRQIVSNRPHLNFFIFLFLFAFFLTTPLSIPVWDFMPGFPFLQFPWRWVPMLELSLCFLIGAIFSVEDMSTLRSSTLRRAIIYLLIIISLASFVKISRSKIIPNKLIDEIMNPVQIKGIIDPVNEYTPIWATNIKKIISEVKNDRVLVISGAALTTITEWKSEKRVITIKASTPTLLRISTFYYPGWEAEIDRHRAQIKIEKESGAMLIDIPDGEHTLMLKFVDTPLRCYAKIISSGSFFIIVFLALLSKRTEHKSIN